MAPYPTHTTTTTTTPLLDPSPPRIHRIVQLAAGDDHLVALTTSGKVYAAAQNAGGDDVGQLGQGPAAGAETATALALPLPSLQFHQVLGLDGVHAAGVACGSHHTLVRTVDGHVYAFGSNRWCQLGQGQFREDALVLSTPVKVGQRWLECRGEQSPRLIGRRRLEPSPRGAGDTPACYQVIGLPAHLKCTQVAAGGNTSVFVMEGPYDCEVYTVGHGQYGQHGNGSVRAGGRRHAGYTITALP